MTKPDLRQNVKGYSNPVWEVFLIHNQFPNSHCMDSSLHQVLYGHLPYISTMYPLCTNTIFHTPPTCAERHVLQASEATPENRWFDTLGTNQKLYGPVCQSHLPRFPDSRSHPNLPLKGPLSEVLTEFFFEEENRSIKSLSLEKYIAILKHLGKAAAGPKGAKWREACKAALNQMKARDVWQVIDKERVLKTIGHFWGFYIVLKSNSIVAKLKAQLVAHGN
ncbi:hypothetical protein O181_100935 [Austropuccinia psidii MF-1]|uniref:Uncharacterized protein n=1 Tax=Austropuccinia psidii MF-1 TaxID=1389203 RepID=A0A9Q3JGK5_9BASI|nr:hypothetical protein [Austropuccinia psidii MF-1]